MKVQIHCELGMHRQEHGRGDMLVLVPVDPSIHIRTDFAVVSFGMVQS